MVEYTPAAVSSVLGRLLPGLGDSGAFLLFFAFRPLPDLPFSSFEGFRVSWPDAEATGVVGEGFFHARLKGL